MVNIDLKLYTIWGTIICNIVNDLSPLKYVLALTVCGWSSQQQSFPRVIKIFQIDEQLKKIPS